MQREGSARIICHASQPSRSTALRPSPACCHEASRAPVSCRCDGSRPLAAEPRCAQRLVRIQWLSRRTHAPQPPSGLCRRARTPGRRLSGRLRCDDSRVVPAVANRRCRGACRRHRNGSECDVAVRRATSACSRRPAIRVQSCWSSKGLFDNPWIKHGGYLAADPTCGPRLRAMVEQTLAAPAARPARSEARAEPARAVSRRSLR